MKYKIGEIYNNREIIRITPNYKYVVKCLSCGKESQINATNIPVNYCRCAMAFRVYKKIRKERPLNKVVKPLNQKLQTIKEKYKNGVTIEHINTMLGIKK